MATRRLHSYDAISADLAQWVHDSSSFLATAMLDDGKAPFAAPLSEQQKLQFYEHQMYGADGSPNDTGRRAELSRLGLAGYAKVLLAVNQARTERATGATGSLGADASTPPEAVMAAMGSGDAGQEQ